MVVIGLMSGTSADGIDAVVAEISGSGRATRATLRAHVHRPFPPRLRWHILRVCLHGHVAEICEAFGIANTAKEALAFAVLARETLLARPGNVPSVTGASRPVVLGTIVPAG